MGWFFRSKKKAELEAERTAQEALRAEVEQLKALNEEAATRQVELEEQLASERELLASERERFDGERAQHSDVLTDLKRRHEELANQIAQSEQKIKLLDEANVAMADMLKGRDADLAHKEQRVNELEADVASSSVTTAAASARATELSDQLAQSKNESNESAARTRELEQQVNSIQAASAAKIAQMEKGLADSEARSEKRAEQRSALLRNMAEIHRLSMTASKTETPPETLKLVQPERDGQPQTDSMANESETIKPSPYFARSSSRKEMSDSDVLQ